jgi:hypothetical protein
MEENPTLSTLIDEVTALRGQVTDLQAREDIRQITSNYMQAMHDARWQDAVECFSDNASYDHGILGELRNKDEIRQFYTEFMPSYEEAGGWAFDILADPVIEVHGDKAEGRWFLLTLLIDPDTQKPAWSIATLDYEYIRERDQWKFYKNHCIHEHLLSPYENGWGSQGGSHVTSTTDAMPLAHFDRLMQQGGKQRPGKRTRSIRGWTVPTLEPQGTEDGR